MIDLQRSRSVPRFPAQAANASEREFVPEPRTEASQVAVALRPVLPNVRVVGRPLRLPARQDRHLPRVLRYLTRQRHLPLLLLEPLLENGKLYADRRGNAVFLMVAGKAQRPVGAELRGTGMRVWRGMAPGSLKDGAYFWIGASGGREIVLCESAIDAISCFAIHPDLICISTAGVRANPRWISGLLAHRYRLQCGFDADAPGDAAAAAMITKHPQITRLRPQQHDWNDVLSLED